VLRRATPERLSAFSDGVFAVLITVLVLELRPPERPTFEALLALWPTWLSYAVSYLFIAIVWANHHYLLRYADEATPRLLWFNFAHLFSMSLLPLSTAWMAVSELAPQPVAFYAAVFFLVNATYIALIWELIDRTPGEMIPPKVRRIMRVRSVLLRLGCRGRAEISAGRARALYLLPGRLSEARAAGSGRLNAPVADRRAKLHGHCREARPELKPVMPTQAGDDAFGRSVVYHSSSFRGDAIASNPESRVSGFSPDGLPRNDGALNAS
jgi:uncharacterized membrane protein